MASLKFRSHHPPRLAQERVMYEGMPDTAMGFMMNQQIGLLTEVGAMVAGDHRQLRALLADWRTRPNKQGSTEAHIWRHGVRQRLAGPC